MNMIIRDSSAIPYGGSYRLDLPEQGLVGVGRTFDELVAAIERYRQANAIPIGLGFVEEVEQAVCANYKAECSVSYPDGAPKPQDLDWKAVIPGLLRLVELKAKGAALVDDAEANRRAAICAVCPWKAQVRLACPALCGDMERVVKALIGSRVTTSNSAIEKKSCGVCRCFLTSAVFVELKAQQGLLSEQEKAGFKEVALAYPCWKAAGL